MSGSNTTEPGIIQLGRVVLFMAVFPMMPLTLRRLIARKIASLRGILILFVPWGSLFRPFIPMSCTPVNG
jgi:hypothetical protein